MVGKSPFLAETQGSFFLAVEAVAKSPDVTGTDVIFFSLNSFQRLTPLF
jgi:hypothetical protein